MGYVYAYSCSVNSNKCCLSVLSQCWFRRDIQPVTGISCHRCTVRHVVSCTHRWKLTVINCIAILIDRTSVVASMVNLSLTNYSPVYHTQHPPGQLSWQWQHVTIYVTWQNFQRLGQRSRVQYSFFLRISEFPYNTVQNWFTKTSMPKISLICTVVLTKLSLVRDTPGHS